MIAHQNLKKEKPNMNKLWLHINDSTPKRQKQRNVNLKGYDYILMIAHQNLTLKPFSNCSVMITY